MRYLDTKSTILTSFRGSIITSVSRVDSRYYVLLDRIAIIAAEIISRALLRKQ